MDAQLLSGIGGYRVERELGAGGMGRVYLCRDDALDRAVAIKILQPELLEQAEMRARFLREARALARVSSPHVVAVHAVGEDAVVGPFVVMEYLEGEDLQARLGRERRVPWRDAVRIARDAVQGLMAAENAGIVHRDLKPANLFDVGGKAKLTDFGLARQVEGGGANVTQAGLVVGTPAYLAPEVIRGTPATHQSDLYSLGATLFHLVAGRPPFTADSPLEVLATAIREEPPLLRSVAPDVPSSLEDLIARMLKKTPGERPPGWAALDDELARVLAGEGAGAAAGRTMTFGTPSPAASSGSSGSPAPVVVEPPSLGALPTMQMPLGTPASAPAVAAPPLTSADPGPRLKTAALTVMMTDIAGYTERTSRVSREESARWLALHDGLLQPVFRAFGGRVVKTLGDAFLVTFSSPTDAVHCACAVQDRLWLYNHGRTHGPVKAEDAIHVRVALSTGEVRLHKGDIFGEPVNLAARLEAIAKPGEVLFSDAVYATMNAAEVKLEPRGEQQLKGIARPVTIYAAVPDDASVLSVHPDTPPFGGRALARVKVGVVDELVAQAPQALARAQAVALRGKKALVAAGGALALAALVGLVSLAGDGRLDRIDGGDAKAVAEEIEQIAAAERTGEDLLLLGHARLALDQRRAGFAAYQLAARKSAVDDRARDAALTALADKEDAGAVELLAQWPSSSIEGELEDLLEGEAWWPRHHAMKILEDRKSLDDGQRVKVALKDLEAESCGDRRHGVLLLKRVGVGDKVLEALKKLREDPLGNACMIFDLPAAEDAVKKRSGGDSGSSER